MTTPVTHFKLGLFALTAIGGFAITAITLGVHAGRKATVAYHTLIDESVQGLKLGAAVRYRGVRIGEVTGIDVADDRRRVEISLAVDPEADARLALATAPPTLAAQLSSQGVTGVKFIDLDFVDRPTDEPRRPHYLPSQPSLGRTLEDEGRRLGRSLPLLVDDARASLHRLDGLVDDVRAAHLPGRLGDTLDHARVAIDSAHGLVPRAAALLDSARRTTDDVSAWLPAIGRTLDAADGLFANARRATDAVGELARRTFGSADELARTLGDLGDAARAVRSFVDALDREPDMLVKGRAPARRP